MAKGLTPIERLLAGEDTDRRRRHEKRMLDQGLVYVRVAVPRERAAELRELAASWRASRRDND
jgi:hypothetical protein